jgi:hypothetical protein
MRMLQLKQAQVAARWLRALDPSLLCLMGLSLGVAHRWTQYYYYVGWLGEVVVRQLEDWASLVRPSIRAEGTLGYAYLLG